MGSTSSLSYNNSGQCNIVGDALLLGRYRPHLEVWLLTHCRVSVQAAALNIVLLQVI